ncbi:hypothetical protein RSAG8_04707, partial [Rhizoctonia solani AG-8 WAC10335]
MPRKKGAKRALNLREYQQRRATAQAAQPNSGYQTPPSSPEPPITPPEVTRPPSAASEAPLNPPLNTPSFSDHAPPIPELVAHAIPELEARVNPKRKSGVGHKKSELSSLALKDLSSILELFRTYTSPNNPDITWRQASLFVSTAKGHGKGH